jgi:diguanylate cyclase (GGDEF)-like protein
VALAFIDSKTKLYNRAALDEISNLPLGFETPYFGIVMLDLTGFKRINDEGSYGAGDTALGLVGSTLSELCKPDRLELPFRYGGDEFCILVAADSFETFVQPSNLQRLRWPDFKLEDKALGFSAAVGYAPPDEEVGMPIIVERAELAAKVSKHNQDEPTRWSPTLEHDDFFSSRRRCSSCLATVAIHVPRRNLRREFLSRCPNCLAVTAIDTSGPD